MTYAPSLTALSLAVLAHAGGCSVSVDGLKLTVRSFGHAKKPEPGSLTGGARLRSAVKQVVDLSPADKRRRQLEYANKHFGKLKVLPPIVGENRPTTASDRPSTPSTLNGDDTAPPSESGSDNVAEVAQIAEKLVKNLDTVVTSLEDLNLKGWRPIGVSWTQEDHTTSKRAVDYLTQCRQEIKNKIEETLQETRRRTGTIKADTRSERFVRNLGEISGKVSLQVTLDEAYELLERFNILSDGVAFAINEAKRYADHFKRLAESETYKYNFHASDTERLMHSLPASAEYLDSWADEISVFQNITGGAHTAADVRATRESRSLVARKLREEVRGVQVHEPTA